MPLFGIATQTGYGPVSNRLHYNLEIGALPPEVQSDGEQPVVSGGTGRILRLPRDRKTHSGNRHAAAVASND